MQEKFQIIKRRVNSEDFEEIKRGNKSFDIFLRVMGQDLDMGDLLTFQEVDESGELTGKELTKKVSSRVDVEELKVPEYVDINKALNNGVSVVGWVAPEQYTLKSVYDFAFTMHLAIDRVEEEELNEEFEGNTYKIIEGPFYSPPLASPEFLEYGILDGFKINKWPIGRYSIVLMIHVEIPEDDKPVDMNAIDAMVMTVKRTEIEKTVIGVPEESLEFLDLDVRALLDGNAITLTGEAVTPSTPDEIDASLEKQMDLQEEQYPDISQADIAASLIQARENGDFEGLDDATVAELMSEIEAGQEEVTAMMEADKKAEEENDGE